MKLRKTENLGTIIAAMRAEYIFIDRKSVK